MGADDRTVLRTVVLPLILPYLVSGYAFAFVLSLNEYIVAYMTVGFTMETLPIKIFNALRYGYTPTMASVTVFFVAIAALVFGLIARFGDIRRLLGAMSSEAQVMRLAALQMQATPGDVAANLARIGAPRSGGAAGAALLVAPELAVTGYGAGDAYGELAEPAEGAAAWLAELAAATGVAIVAGFAERDGGRSTTAPCFADGRRRPTVYRKSHLYGPYERSLFAASPPRRRCSNFPA